MLKRGTLVVYKGRQNFNHVGKIMFARHSVDRYLVRWVVTFKDGETKTWIDEHSRMALLPAI